MKSLIVYSSRTGNTKKVAEAIHEIMPMGTELCPAEEAPNPDDYDFIAIGYWVDRGTADEKAKEYIEKVKSKKVAIFGTLGAYPDSEHAFRSRENVKKLLNEKNEIIGDFLCQGKIDPKLTERLKKLPPDHPHWMTEERLKRHMESRNHPNEEDLDNAKGVFKEVIKILEGTM